MNDTARVALELMQTIGKAENTIRSGDQHTRAYWLKLYAECATAVTAVGQSVQPEGATPRSTPPGSS